MVEFPSKRRTLFIPDAARACFVVIDMQNFSCAPPFDPPMPGIDRVIRQTNLLAAICRRRGVPVVWVRHNLTSDGAGDDGGLYGAFHEARKTALVTNRSEATEIYSELEVDPSTDHVVFKNRYSAFLSNPPELRDLLLKLGRTQLFISGVAANVCVESTLRDAMQLDYEVILVSDCIAAPDPEALQQTMNNTAMFFGDVRSVDEIESALA